MLRKLIKYDLKWVYKVVLVFYALTFIFSGIGRALKFINNSVIFSVVSGISISIAISMMVSSLINCFMRLWARFVRNVYKDESYLTHTLPVSKNKIYIAKVLSAIITLFTTFVVIISCLFICFYSKTNIGILKSALELAASTYDITVIGLVLLICLVIFLEILFVVLIGYSAIILGHQFNTGKMIKTIVLGVSFYLATQTASLFFVFLLGLVNSKIMNLINTTDIINVDAIKAVMCLGILIYIIYIIFYYFLGKKSFENGVNVE